MRAGLEKRFDQVRARLDRIDDYMHKAGPYELPTKGERLAEKRAGQAQPDLAASFQQVIGKEKSAAIELQRAKIMNSRQGKEEQRTMKQESIEDLKQRTDANRMTAEKGERVELEKAGRLASLQEQSAEQKHDENQITKQQSNSLTKELNAGTEKADLVKEARKLELLARFKEKARSDRSNDWGQSR